MTPRFRTASPARWRRASSPTSTATAGSSPPPRPHAERRSRALALAALALTCSCAYLNTFYNARQAYDEGVRLAAGSDSLPAAAAEAFRVAAEKSAIVLEHYPDSDYVDDALILMAKSFYQLGSWGDAAASYQRYVERFPDGDAVADARLGWARSERRMGDYAAAETALAPLLESGGAADGEVVFEHALILLATGRPQRAGETYRRLLEERPEVGADPERTLEFADAQLAAGEVDEALAAYRALAEFAVDPQRRQEIEIRAARALARGGRVGAALEAYDRVLSSAVVDSLAAEVEAERGELLLAQGDWEAASAAFARTADLAPGSVAASRGTLHRGRIVWRIEGRREEALDILLDAFIHSPMSAWGDSARTESRELARLLHYQRIAAGEVPVPRIEDPGLARATAMYRLAEEVLEVEHDPEAAAEMFWQLARRFPETPWQPWAMLASGILLTAETDTATPATVGTGVARLLELVESHPDHPAADSARRELGFDVPARPGDFYAADPRLVALARVLPRGTDPMVEIEDQMDRYGNRTSTSAGRLRDRTLDVARDRASARDDGGQPEETPPSSPNPDDEVSTPSNIRQ